jgi:hypothetical protein
MAHKAQDTQDDEFNPRRDKHDRSWETKRPQEKMKSQTRCGNE